MASSMNLVSTIGALASPKMGDGTRCPEGTSVQVQVCKCKFQIFPCSIQGEIPKKIRYLNHVRRGIVADVQ